MLHQVQLFMLVLFSFFEVAFFEASNTSNQDVINMQEDLCDLPSCPDPFANSTLEHSCLESKGLAMRGRCCVRLNNNNMIVSVDLSFCKIISLDKILSQQAIDVEKINLTHNPELMLKEDNFRGLKSLSILYLPPHISCPGNWSWFNTSWQAWNVMKHKATVQVCSNQTDTCSKLTFHNYTCPQQSKCFNDGPGMFRCECSEIWIGYKCLRLPSNVQLFAIGGSTLVATPLLSLALWCFGRRHLR